MTDKPKTALLKNIPAEVHKAIKLAAVTAGKTLEQFFIDSAADAARKAKSK